MCTFKETLQNILPKWLDAVVLLTAVQQTECATPDAMHQDYNSSDSVFYESIRLYEMYSFLFIHI